MGIIPKTAGISMKVRISKNPDVMRLELMKGGAVRMQDGGKLPPGVKRAVERAQTSKSVVPIPGIRQASEALQGFIGFDPRYSVMDPEAESLASAYRGGESASVISDLVGALSPFAYASAMSKASQIPGMAELIAYHGSPHKFKKFDASKIGTGEGAQAFGHGLYFAESPDVAKTYIASGSRPAFDVEGAASNLGLELNRDAQTELRRQAKTNYDSLTAAKWLQSANKSTRQMPVESLAKVIEQYRDATKPTPSFYKVDIPDEKIAQMLDWDKPLSQQSDVVKRAILGREIVDPKLLYKKADEYLEKGDATSADFVKRQAFALENDLKRTGEGWYQTLASQKMPSTGDVKSNMQKGSAAAAQALRDAGVPGIRYLDQGSRAAGKGTSNFVVFPGEEESIKMLEINNAPPMKKGGAVRISNNLDTMRLELLRKKYA